MAGELGIGGEQRPQLFEVAAHMHAIHNFQAAFDPRTEGVQIV